MLVYEGIFHPSGNGGLVRKWGADDYAVRNASGSVSVTSLVILFCINCRIIFSLYLIFLTLYMFFSGV